MEGSGAQPAAPQPAAPPAAPAPAPKKRTMMYAAIAVVVVIAVAAVAAVLLMGGSGGGLASAWDPQQGQYLDYSMSMSMGDQSYSGTMHMVVKSVDADTVTINMTITVAGMDPMYQEVTTDKANASFAYFDTQDMPSDIPVTYSNVSMSTPWGTQTCQHLGVTDTGISVDVYLYQDVMVKMTMTMSSEGGDMTITATLTGTNIA